MKVSPTNDAVEERRAAPVSVGEHVAALLDGKFSHGLAGFAEDVVWHVPGGGELGGEHRGREAVLALIGLLLAPSYGRARVAYRTLSEHGGYTFEWVEIRTRPDAAPMVYPLVSRVEKGRIREVWWCGEGAA